MVRDPKPLRKLSREIAPLLSLIVNKSINEGKFPDIRKNTVVKPIHKNGYKSDITVRIHFSLLSVSCLKKLYKNKSLIFLNKYKMLSENH